MLEVNEDPYKSEIIKPRLYCPCQRVSRCACPTYHMCGNPNMGKWRTPTSWQPRTTMDHRYMEVSKVMGLPPVLIHL